MDQNKFSEFETTLAERGLPGALEQLAKGFLDEQKHHELFDIRLMQARQRLGLSLVTSTALEELPIDKRQALEAAYMAACAEVGELLLAQNKLRESWMYFQPLGKPEKLAAKIEQITATEENLEELVELTLGHRIAPVYGFKLILENYGMCNAITSFDREMQRSTPAEQHEAAKLLVADLYDELVAVVKKDIKIRANEDVDSDRLADLIAGRDWLFEGGNYHTDTSHIHSVIRIARTITDKDTLSLACEICEYGKKLVPDLQAPGDLPFEDMYEASALFFDAQIGNRVDEAIEYFTKIAEATDAYSMGTGPAETLIVLLARIGRGKEAIAAAVRWVPPGTHNGGFAPSLFELSRQSGQFDALKDFSRERGDLINFAVALATEYELQQAGKSA